MTDLDKLYSYQIKRVPRGPAGVFAAVCSCGKYTSTPNSRRMSDMKGRAHINGHIRRLMNPNPAKIRTAGVRRIDGRTSVQVLASTINGTDAARRSIDYVVSLDFTPRQARELAKKLLSLADQADGKTG